MFRLITILCLCSFVFAGCANKNKQAEKKQQPKKYFSGFLSTNGSKIVDDKGNEVNISGVNWYGAEYSYNNPEGLMTRRADDIIKQIKTMGFNTVRIPYNNAMLDEGAQSLMVNYQLNPDLTGLNPLQVLDKIIDKCVENGIRVFIDQHRPDGKGQSPLWYSDTLTEEKWLNDWSTLAKRYKNNPTVIGADLHNEPNAEATWGTNDPKTDWKMAAEKCGNAILKENPDWLIIVEGVEKYNGTSNWWGGNLQGVAKSPIKLSVDNKLVYSAHEYCVSVGDQPWFNDPKFPNNMPGLWDKNWGFIVNQNIAPIIIGEFGGKQIYKKDEIEGKWFDTLAKYIKEKKLSWTYWSLNPESNDTGGILVDDGSWKTIDNNKLNVLKPLQYPLIK